MAGNLSKKLLAVLAAIDGVEKAGKNIQQNYAYVRATDVAKEVRAVLIKEGVGFDYSVISTNRWEKLTNSGGTLFFVEVWVRTTFTDIETGEQAEATGVGWGMDTGDKAIYKALTGALKYALRMRLMIPDELDPENDSRDKEEPKEVQRASVKQQLQASVNLDSEPPIEAYDNQTPVNTPERPKPTVVKKSTQGGVGIPRGKRWFAIAMSSGRTKEELNEYLASLGVERSEDIPVKHYNDACEWAAGQ